MMIMFLKRSRQLVQLSYLYRGAYELSTKTSKALGFESEVTSSSSVQHKGANGNAKSNFNRFQFLPDSGDNVRDYKIEIVDDQTWGVSAGLADAWRGVEQTRASRNDVVDEFAAYVPPNKDGPDFDEIEDMRIRGNLFYKLDKDSKEYEEYNVEFHRKKSSKNGGEQNETKKEKPNHETNFISEKSSKNRDAQKESKRKEDVTGLSSGSRKLHNANENYYPMSSLNEIHKVHDEKKLRTPTFNQLTAPYHEPFCLDIYISKASVRACIVHRATSKVVAVAHSISKDMKFDLGSTRNAVA